MLGRTRALENIDRRYAREVLADRTYLDALAVFEALWRHATLLSPDFRSDWREDVASDLQVAGTLNGLPSGA